MNENSMNNAVTMRPQSGASLGRIDQYELIRELGGGGFGCVYLAKDTVAGIEVAVKGLPPLVRLNKEELENVRKNFALVSRLHHPNIAAALTLHPVTTAFYDDKSDAEKLRVFKGDTLVVMQYAPGVTLSQWRKQFPDGKVPLDKALEITRQIASALDYAHTQRIIHRDIKPANVIIETDANGKVMARVLDFGIAAEIRSSMGRVSREVTDTSGTRPYMAPEQWLGKKQGERTDQYSLAVLFYELIIGEVPFASVFETGDSVIMMNVVRQETPEFPHDISEPLRQAMSKALSKKQEERFLSCLEFADAISSRELQSIKEAFFPRVSKNRDKAKSIDSEFIDKVHLLKQVDQTISETEKISSQSKKSNIAEYLQAMLLARKEMDGVNLSRCREIQESIELLRDKINDIVHRNDIQMRASKIFDSIRDRTKDCADLEIVKSKLDVAEQIKKEINRVPIGEVDGQLQLMTSLEQEIEDVCSKIRARRSAIAYAQDLRDSISSLSDSFQESDVLRVLNEEASDVFQKMKDASDAELLECKLRLETIKQTAEEECNSIRAYRSAIAYAQDLRDSISSLSDSFQESDVLRVLNEEASDIFQKMKDASDAELLECKLRLETIKQTAEEECNSIRARRSAIIAYAQDLRNSISSFLDSFHESDVLRVLNEEASGILQKMKDASDAELLEYKLRLETIKQTAEEECNNIRARRDARRLRRTARNLRWLISSSMDSCLVITTFLKTLQCEVSDVERRIDTTPFEELREIESSLSILESKFNLLMMEYQRRRRRVIKVFVSVFILIPIFLILCAIIAG